MERLIFENVDFGNPAEVDAFLEQVMAAGMARVRAETAELRARGLIDQHGNLVNVPTVKLCDRNIPSSER